MKIKKAWSDILSSLKMLWNLDRVLFLVCVGRALIEGAIPYIEIYLSAYVLDGLTTGIPFRTFLQAVCLVLVGILILKILKAYMDKIYQVHIEICYRKFNMLLGKRTLEMDYELLDSPKVNEINNRIANDNDWGAGFLSVVFQFPTLLRNMLNFVLAIVILIPLFKESSVFNEWYTVVVLLLFVLVCIFNTAFSTRKQKEYHNLLSSDNGDYRYRSYYVWGGRDYKQGMDVRIFNGQKMIEEHICEEDNRQYLPWTKSLTVNGCQRGLASGLSTGILQTAAYLFVAIRAILGALSVGSLVKYATVIYRFSSALSGVFNMFSEFALTAKRQQSSLDYINVEDVLPKGSLPVDKRGFCDIKDNDYEIELRNVSFKYPGSENWSLRNVSLKLHVGERLAIVGMNGSGKTTLIKLLCRLYDPTEGEILLNGVDIRKYDYREYVSLFSVVFQDFKLFAFRLGENVAAAADYDREKVLSCLEKAGLGERLASMQQGTDTYLYNGYGENGVEISGGEAQKIALARALYKDAPFVVLDEPTAALDPIAEYDIYTRFNELVENKTAIYISHRLSSCRFCDDIAVFHEGQMIQRGSHEQLLAETGSKYCEMWNAQAQYYT